MSRSKPPIGFWIVSAVALLWNLMGVNAYIQEAYRVEAYMAQYTSEEIALINARPSWVTALFAIAVFSGFIGCILLLLRKRFAKFILIISFITATIQQVWFFVNYGSSITNLAKMVMPVLVIVVCLFLVWFAHNAIQKKWLN